MQGKIKNQLFNPYLQNIFQFEVVFVTIIWTQARVFFKLATFCPSDRDTR